MANTFQTSRHTELVALRAAESAGYLTIGSKKYLKDQLKGKRNGTEYDFVIRDAGEFQEGIDLSATGPSALKERKVTKKIEVGNIMIDTNLLEKVTDLSWDEEVAYPNGKALIKGVVNKAVNADLGWQNTAFAGAGFQPLFKAGNFLASVSDENKYGFIDPMINSVLSSNGQAFTPVDAEPLYRSGLLGKMGEVEYRSTQFMPLVSVSAGLATEVAKCSAITYAKQDSTHATLTLTGVGAIIPKGFVVWVKGCYATDYVGARTSALRAFVAYEDGTANGVMKIRPVAFEGVGTKEICDIDGNALGATEAAAITAFNAIDASNLVSLPQGDYFAGIIRLGGTTEFETLDTIDASNADTKLATNEGINVFENRAIDVIKGSNVTRWTVSSISGIVEPRGVAFVLVKDAAVNQVVIGQ